MTKGASHVTAFATSVALSADGAAVLVDGADGTASQRVRLLPIGNTQTRGKGMVVVADAVHANQVVAASRLQAGADDILVDYDHQSVYGAVDGVGGTAPASGWIKPASLSVEPDGIYATIDWTAAAATAIKARGYRYLSPVINHDDKGRVQRLINVGLTNSPAIDGLAKLAASASLNQETTMDLTALAASLGLPATATYDEILAASTARATALAAAQGNYTALTAALGLEANADHTTALSAATTLKAGGNAQTALMTGMQADLVRLNNERIVRVVDDNVKAGRITPAQRDGFVDLMRTNEKSALALMASAPVIVGSASQLGGSPTGEKITALSAEQKQVCALTGVAEADFLKTLQEDAQ